MENNETQVISEITAPVIAESDAMLVSAEKPSNALLPNNIWTDKKALDQLARSAKMWSDADITPKNYQGNSSNCAIAVEMASRMGVSPMMVMQNLYVVNNKPSWSGQSCMTFIRSKYKKVKVIYVGDEGTDNWGCYIKATDEDGDIIEGTTVTIAMAKAEGWYTKKDRFGKETSKWQTMPKQMLAYRAAAFFARVYCPESLMGVYIEGEAEDIAPAEKSERVEL